MLTASLGDSLAFPQAVQWVPPCSAHLVEGEGGSVSGRPTVSPALEWLYVKSLLPSTAPPHGHYDSRVTNEPTEARRGGHLAKDTQPEV